MDILTQARLGAPGNLWRLRISLVSSSSQARSIHCPDPDQLCEQKKMGSSVRGSQSAWTSFSGPSASSLEACPQVDLNVDFGRAKGLGARAGFLVALLQHLIPLPVWALFHGVEVEAGL